MPKFERSDIGAFRNCLVIESFGFQTLTEIQTMTEIQTICSDFGRFLTFESRTLPFELSDFGQLTVLYYKTPKSERSNEPNV